MNNSKDVYAFPMIGEVNASNPDERFAVYNRGMTLRDYFAGQALIGMAECEHLTTQQITRIAYEVADGMLEARQGRQEIENE